MSYSSRVLRVCALLALPTSAFAQSTKGPTIFSPASQVGTVNLRAAIVLQDYTVKPLPLLKVVALKNNERPDSVAAQTDLDGRATLTLNVGMYTVRARTPQPVGGRMYEWAVKVVVRPQQSQSLDLTNSNASRSDSVATTPTVVAEAKPTPQAPPTAAPQPTPVQPAPTQAAPTQPTPTQPSATQPQPQTAQAKATPAKGTPAKGTQPKTTQPQPAQPQPVTPPSVAPTAVASQPSSPPAAPPKSTAPSNPVPSVKPAPTSTGEKAVAKSEPPKPTPTPTPAPATPSSAPVTTAKATPVPPAPSASPAAKQVAAKARPPRRTNTSGLMLGLSFDASSIRSDDLNSRTESGPGIAGMLGWGITKNIALALDLSGAQISSVDGNYNLGHADIGARWHFVNRTAFVPFVDVGYAGRALMKRDVTLTDALGNTSTGTLTYMGAGLSYGGGLQYFVTPGIAFGGAFKWTTGRFSEVRFENLTVEDLQLDASSARFNMGFTWYPMGHR
jgi:hypothetical protein